MEPQEVDLHFEARGDRYGAGDLQEAMKRSMEDEFTRGSVRGGPANRKSSTKARPRNVLQRSSNEGARLQFSAKMAWLALQGKTTSAHRYNHWSLLVVDVPVKRRVRQRVRRKPSHSRRRQPCHACWQSGHSTAVQMACSDYASGQFAPSFRRS